MVAVLNVSTILIVLAALLVFGSIAEIHVQEFVVLIHVVMLLIIFQRVHVKLVSKEIHSLAAEEKSNVSTFQNLISI